MFTPDHPLEPDPQSLHDVSPSTFQPSAGDAHIPRLVVETPHSESTSPHGSTPGVLNPSGAPNTSDRPQRRVQWTSDSHIVAMHPPVESISSNPSQRLDHDNLDLVNDALERHRRQTISRRTGAARRGTSRTTDNAQNNAEEDYDYRLDTGPAPLEPVQSGGSDTRRQESDRMTQLLDHGHHTGQLIPLGEMDGLPNIDQSETRNDLSAATDLVRAHTGRWGVLRRRVRGAGAVNAMLTQRQMNQTVPIGSLDNEKAVRAFESDRDGWRSPPRPDNIPHEVPPIPGGASVLSSLLALYGQRDIPGSQGTSLASSRASSRTASDDEDEADHERADTHAQKESNASAFYDSGRAVVEDASEGTIIHHEPRPGSLAVDAPNQRSSGAPDTERSQPAFVGAVRKAKQQWKDKNRPKAARSSAGVFGALIQETGNLSGAATPAASTLTPAAQRPGFQLSRYSLPDVNPRNTKSPWRPQESRPGSRSASRPASVHSSTAVSQNDDSPRDDLRKTLSTDDVLATREKKRSKGLSFDAIGRLPGTALHEGVSGLRNAERWIAGMTPLGTPPDKILDGFLPRTWTEEDRRRREREVDRKKRKKAREARKKQEIFIIQHVAAILARQQFLLKLARALMMFGSPSHRLETQIQATAKVLEINAQVVYLPGTMLVSFGDDATHTSETKFLKQATGLDLGKLLATHDLYWKVVHDKMSVDQASKDLDVLMTTLLYYTWWQTLIIGAMCSAFIVVISFYGSFIDALMAMPLGMTLVGVQMLAARNDMFSNVFEIAIACLISFVSAALASSGAFCYTALVSGGVVLILPGYIVLCGALELASRNITAGALTLHLGVIYSLFLGFGISIGAEIYTKITGLEVLGADDYTCAATHAGAVWYKTTPSAYWYFLCCPGYAFFLSLRNQQPLFAMELPIMVLVAAAGWCCNHFSALAFPNRSSLTSAIGSFAVGTLGNIYGRFSNGASFPVTVTGILFQLPSGLANGGIFSFAAESTSGSTTAYSDGFTVAEQLVSVAIGLTVGLFVSAVVTHPFGGGRRRGAGIFSF